MKYNLRSLKLCYCLTWFRLAVASAFTCSATGELQIEQRLYNLRGLSIYIKIHLLPAGRALCAWPAGPKITLLFPRLLVCASTLITCAIITSRKLLPCDLQSTSAQLWSTTHYDFEMDTEKQRQRRRDDARLTESGNARSEQLNTRGAYRVANQI